MKRLRNTSGIPDAAVREIVAWIAADLGISQFDVEVRSSEYAYAGRAYTQGSRCYHGNRRPFVVLRVGTETEKRWQLNGVSRKFISLRRQDLERYSKDGYQPSRVSKPRFPTTVTPYQYAQHKGKRYVLASRVEALVYLAAHELRHLWQAARWSDRRKSANLPLYHGAKGKFSEVDTEAYAIHTLRAWRNRG